jgi:predicted nucleic acid-binding protein
MATPVCVDTGAHYALADVQDPDHDEAVRLLHQIVRLRYALVTSNFVLSEVYTLVRQRLGWGSAMQYVEGLRAGATQVISVTPAEEERAWEILRRYDDQDFRYVDATSFALMERMGIHVFFAFDAHFSTFRTQRGQAFTNIKFLV